MSNRLIDWVSELWFIIQSDRRGNVRRSGQTTSNFLTQESWRLYEVKQPATCLCVTSNFLINTTAEFSSRSFGEIFSNHLWREIPQKILAMLLKVGNYKVLPCRMSWHQISFILTLKPGEKQARNFATKKGQKSILLDLTRDFHSPPFLEEKGCISGNFSPPALQLKDSVYHIHFLGSAFLFLPFCLVMTEMVLQWTNEKNNYCLKEFPHLRVIFLSFNSKGEHKRFLAKNWSSVFCGKCKKFQQTSYEDFFWIWSLNQRFFQKSVLLQSTNWGRKEKNRKPLHLITSPHFAPVPTLFWSAVNILGR